MRVRKASSHGRASFKPHSACCTSELADDYASAWAEWDEEDDKTWDRSSRDGLTS